MEVAGQVKISGGSPGAGKVLTSDESGLATWQPAASGGDLSYGSSALSPNDAVFVTDAGRVGIGSTAPEGKLQVTGDISTGSGAIRWKTFQGTTAPSGANSSFAHGLAAANVLAVHCGVRAAGGTYYNFGATNSGARFVSWSDVNVIINYEAAADWWSRPYRCIAQYVEAISDVDGFSAVTGADDAGDILISVNFPGAVGMYDYVSVRRLAGATPPNADCTSDGTVIHAFNSFSDATIKDSHASGGLIGGNFYSYRLCIFGTDGSMTSFATASNVQAKLPANVDGFSAVTGSINLGDINVSVNFATDVSDYNRVEVRRKVGATPPLASCDDGSDHVRTYTTYTDVSYTDQLNSSTYYSYRVCVFGNDGSLVSTTTAANVLTFSNYTTFITSTLYNGNLGGVTGADQKCQERATAAGLANPSSYRAIISTSTQSAYDRLVINGPIYNTLGALVAANKADFWDSQWSADDLMRKTESGNNFLDYVWTGIDGGNGGIASNNCSNWTSTSGSGQIGWPDRKDSNGDDVFDISSRSCSATQPLYCLSNQ